MSRIFPVLREEVAAEVLAGLPAQTDELPLVAASAHPGMAYPAVGSVTPEEDVRALGQLLRELASGEGYPNDARGQALVRFDQSAAGPLHRAMSISPWHAADEGLWAFITLVVAPDVAVWRYPQRHPDRLLGGHRNVFRRLWWRAELLGSGADDPPALMGEDQLVGVMERTDALGGDPRIARAFCLAVLRCQETSPQLPRMMLQRESAKWVTRATSLRALPALTDSDLRDAMEEAVSAAAAGLSRA